MALTAAAARACLPRHFFFVRTPRRATLSSTFTFYSHENSLSKSCGRATGSAITTRRYASTENISEDGKNMVIDGNGILFGGVEARFFSDLNRSTLDHQVHPQIKVERKSMDWNTYFALRGTRRLYEITFAALTVPIGSLGGAYYLAQQTFNPSISICGMDQVVMCLIGGATSGFLGLAVGPVAGDVAFRLVYRDSQPLVDKMDKEFFNRIALNRAKPAGNLLAPFPDYYGEGIASVHDYRAWLRKQREYNRSTMFFV
ncbi:TIM23 complex component [Linnemannia zychae]|nr:TIM23 complex component [Linnemannia zychae]